MEEVTVGTGRREKTGQETVQEGELNTKLCTNIACSAHPCTLFLSLLDLYNDNPTS